MKHDPTLTGRDAVPARFAVVDHEKSWLKAPLNWRLRIYGQGVGGYAAADGSVSRYADKGHAERAGHIWIESGIYPAHQQHRRTSGSLAKGG